MLDAARFVGRRDILARIDRLLHEPGPSRVLHIHGPGGIGKSALLREVGRRAQEAGRVTWQIDARALEPVPGELAEALDGAVEAEGAVVTIDSFERVPALDSLLRDRILPSLAADALVLVAGRGEPDQRWFRDGWEHVVHDLPLAPLPAGDAAHLLAARGVTDPDVAAQLIDWAGGSPLALSVAAESTSTDPAALDGVDLNQMILSRLAGDELNQVDGEVLEVAAVARAVDSRLLAAVLPGRPTRTAGEALRRSTVAELVGGRMTLHDLVRTSLRDDLRLRDRPRYDRLRQAIADHLLLRASSGEVRLVSDLIQLIDDPEVRWGIGGYAHDRFRIDPWDLDDVSPLVGSFLEQRGDNPEWWTDLARLLDQAPELGLVARNVEGEPVAFCVATAAGSAPAAAEQDRLLAPLLADARAQGTPDAILFRETHGATGTAGDAARGALNLAAVIRSGLANVRRSYILDTAPLEESRAFFRAVGAVHQPQLDTEIAGHTVACWIIDHGSGGMLGQIRDVIYGESGSAPAAPASPTVELQQAALEALRAFHRPDALARNPLTAGFPVADRAELLRQAVVRAVDAAFSDEPGDRLLRDVVTLGDLTSDITHERAMTRLSVSRATYFRQLRKARQRVGELLLQQLDG